MDPDELERWAEASRLLSGMGDRWRHVQAVAARAAEIGSTFDEQDRATLIGAAWLHDDMHRPWLPPGSIRSMAPGTCASTAMGDSPPLWRITLLRATRRRNAA